MNFSLKTKLNLLMIAASLTFSYVIVVINGLIDHGIQVFASAFVGYSLVFFVLGSILVNLITYKIIKHSFKLSEEAGNVDFATRELKQTIEELGISTDKLISIEKELLVDMARILQETNQKVQAIEEIFLQSKMIFLKSCTEASKVGGDGGVYAEIAKEIGRLAKTSAITASELKEGVSCSTLRLSKIMERAEEIQREDMIKEPLAISNAVIMKVEKLNAEVSDLSMVLSGKKTSRKIAPANLVYMEERRKIGPLKVGALRKAIALQKQA